MTEQKLVVTLLAEKGKKWDETQQCISSHEGSIVFLPKEVSVGDVVRVELSPVSEKLDARGKVMHSAKFAHVILSGNIRRLIAREATLLRGCQVFDQQTALALLRAKYGVELDAWKGYSHYFFEESGWVFGSHLPSATLFLYEQFGSMAPHAVTEPLLWAIDKRFFTLREQGVELDWRSSIPQLTDEAVAEVVKKVEAGEPVLSQALVRVVGGWVEIPALTDALWRSASWPTLVVPDFESGASTVIPPIVSHEYGRDPNGEILKGYGVLTLSREGLASWQWLKDFVSATIALEQSEQTLSELRQVWVSKAQMKPQLIELNARRKVVGLPELELRSTNFRVNWSNYEYTPENVSKFAEEARAKEEAERKTALEAVMQKALQEKAEAEAQRTASYATRMQPEVEAGRALANFSAFVHTSSQHGDGGGYVIRSDGSLREHDRDEYTKSHCRGTHTVHWDFVEPEEGAIVWSGSFTTANYCCIEKAPVSGWTAAQIATVVSLEEKHGATGKGWGEIYSTIKIQPQSVLPKPKVPTKESEVKVPSGVEKGFDPDHPFAKLVALREQMSGKK